MPNSDSHCTAKPQKLHMPTIARKPQIWRQQNKTETCDADEMKSGKFDKILREFDFMTNKIENDKIDQSMASDKFHLNKKRCHQ